jgi:hypothetical protein
MDNAAFELHQVVPEANGDEHVLFRRKGTVRFQQEAPFTDVTGPAHAADDLVTFLSQNDIFHEIEGFLSIPPTTLPVFHPAFLLWCS